MHTSLFTSCQELFFPSYCLECEQRLPCHESLLLCNNCLSKVAIINSPLCSCCGIPFQAGVDHLCGICLQNKYSFDLARAALYYREPVAQLISTFKFNGSLAGLSTLTNLVKISTASQMLTEPDIIIPVPLHKQRLRKRQFNQALLICQSCFPDIRKKIHSDILVRHRKTSPQTGLNGAERRKNLAGAFSIQNKTKIRDNNILLVDDVFTTGQTVHECAKVLRKAGAKRIEVFTLARAV